MLLRGLLVYYTLLELRHFINWTKSYKGQHGIQLNQSVWLTPIWQFKADTVRPLVATSCKWVCFFIITIKMNNNFINICLFYYLLTPLHLGGWNSLFFAIAPPRGSWTAGFLRPGLRWCWASSPPGGAVCDRPPSLCTLSRRHLCQFLLIFHNLKWNHPYFWKWYEKTQYINIERKNKMQ